jgi:hypothetical protein
MGPRVRGRVSLRGGHSRHRPEASARDELEASKFVAPTGPTPPDSNSVVDPGTQLGDLDSDVLQVAGLSNSDNEGTSSAPTKAGGTRARAHVPGRATASGKSTSKKTKNPEREWTATKVPAADQRAVMAAAAALASQLQRHETIPENSECSRALAEGRCSRALGALGRRWTHERSRALGRR